MEGIIKVNGLDKLTDEDLLHVAKTLIPAAFFKRSAGYWKVKDFSDLGVEFPGKAIVAKRNHYRFEFSFDTGDVEVIHDTMGDYDDRVCPDIAKWWQVINFLTERGCTLAEEPIPI